MFVAVTREKLTGKRTRDAKGLVTAIAANARRSFLDFLQHGSNNLSLMLGQGYRSKAVLADPK